jgi:hypothetical protein
MPEQTKPDKGTHVTVLKRVMEDEVAGKGGVG